MRIYFDGGSTVLNFRKCYDWTNKSKDKNNGRLISYPDNILDAQTNIGIHGPFNDEYDKNNVIFYSDFSFTSLCNRFGKALTNGITPRVRGYTIDGNDYVHR